MGAEEQSGCTLVFSLPGLAGQSKLDDHKCGTDESGRIPVEIARGGLSGTEEEWRKAVRARRPGDRTSAARDLRTSHQGTESCNKCTQRRSCNKRTQRRPARSETSGASYRTSRVPACPRDKRAQEGTQSGQHEASGHQPARSETSGASYRTSRVPACPRGKRALEGTQSGQREASGHQPAE